MCKNGLCGDLTQQFNAKENILMKLGILKECSQ